ncbi:MAG: hypothetical protein J0L88_02110 [Xanthomonadales bacterium]|nr:hypothetical protein [Xanthomonadales bacterium]
MNTFDLPRRLASAGRALALAVAAIASVPLAAQTRGQLEYHFEARAVMPLNIGGHATTVLDSGLVMVAGGQAQNGTYQSATYLYNPASDEWTTSGSLAQARRGIRLARLPNGDVIAIGGSLGNSSAQVERFDPSAGTWSSLNAMVEARDNHAVVELQDGSILVIGGRKLVNGAGTILSSVERFDPATGQWEARASLAAARMNHTATLLANGEVLVAGGYTSSPAGAMTTAEIYNPVTNQWRAASPLPEPRMNQHAVTIASGEVMLAGGNVEAFGAGATVGLIYDPVQDAWRSSAPSTLARRNTSVERLPDGRVAVIGGGSPSELPVAGSAEIYDPASNAWTPLLTLVERRFLPETVVLPSGNVLVIGGQRPTPSTSYLAAVEEMVGTAPDAIFSDGFDEVP